MIDPLTIEDKVINLEEGLELSVTETKPLLSRIGKPLYDLQEFYFKPREFEKKGKVYEWLGVRTFKKFLPTFGDYVNRFVFKPLGMPHLINKSNQSLQTWATMTKVYETLHLTDVPIYSLLTIGMLAIGSYDGVAIGIGLNLAINVYPIMTQRYNRGRIHRVLERQKRLESRQK